MEKTKISFTSVANRFGILISAAFIAYFLLMKILSLTHVAELRLLNILILIGGLVLAMSFYKSKSSDRGIPYLKGLGLGVMTTFVSFALFTVFLFFYFTLIDPQLLTKIGEQSIMLGPDPSAFYASFAVMVEGVASGLVISFILMQYYKSNYSDA